jgi:hypothetical protein
MKETYIPSNFTVDADFIKEAHKEASTEWKTKIEKKFPVLFPAKYKQGQRFINKGTRLNEEYILANVNGGSMILLSLKWGNRFTNPVEVLDPTNVTQEEFHKIAAFKSHVFELIK